MLGRLSLTTRSLSLTLLTFVVTISWLSLADAASTFTWQPASLYISLQPGQTATTSVSLASAKKEANVWPWITPEIAPLLTVSPTNFPTIAAGAMTPVSVTATASSVTSPNLLKGTVHLRKGNATLSRPLPVIITVGWTTFEQVSDLGVRIDRPPQWVEYSDSDSIYFSNAEKAPALGDPARQNYAFFRITVRRNENPHQLPAREWFESSLRPLVLERIGSEASTKVAGQTAHVVETSQVGGAFLNIFFARKTDIIQVSYPRYAPALLETYAAMLASLQILP